MVTRKEIERLAVVEEQIKNQGEKIDAIDQKITDFIRSADRKYASKTTEKIVYGLVGTILMAFVWALLRLFEVSI